MRTEKEIDKKIKELIGDSDNFTSDNFGSEGHSNGYYEVNFSEFASENTLRKFADWMLGKD